MKQKAAPKITKDDVQKLMRGVRDLTTKSVLVGVPETTSSRADEHNVTNAQLAYWHDMGVPSRNIPQREFMQPGIIKARPAISRYMRQAAKYALEGRLEMVPNMLYNAGLAAQNGIRQKITEGPFVPLADSTVQRRANRRSGKRPGAQVEMYFRTGVEPTGKKAKALLKKVLQGKVPRGSLAKPLIDTGSLRQSVTFVIRNKESA